ncbi:tumor necrosis factor receptor superfamily member 9 [Rhineura floridana]|uniref:tumor necrosis factor receptor superfamily member 9 n=1 Tax=Rhineura floridana TaxID=261503 RepID=UPI002AC7FB71|nr:tumor necrosis factor receptor superfamily member 9 [Rhineura floridana]
MARVPLRPPGAQEHQEAQAPSSGCGQSALAPPGSHATPLGPPRRTNARRRRAAVRTGQRASGRPGAQRSPPAHPSQPPMGHLVAAVLLTLLLLWSRRLSAQKCEDGTYREASSGKCIICKGCEGIFAYAQPCSESANAICRCLPEYECEGRECGTCTCDAGKEWMGAGCQDCPEGKFKSLKTGTCRSWTQCSANNILTPGTKTTDVICKNELEGLTQPPPFLVVSVKVTDEDPFQSRLRPSHSTETAVMKSTDDLLIDKSKERDSQLIPISIALTVALFLCMAFLILFCIFFRSWAQEKFPAVMLKLPLGQSAQEMDECSFRYPEEEEGGGTEMTGLKGDAAEKIP